MESSREQVIGIVRTKGIANARDIAGALGWRSQDAGRVAEKLRRDGTLIFVTEINPNRAGYRLAERTR